MNAFIFDYYPWVALIVLPTTFCLLAIGLLITEKHLKLQQTIKTSCVYFSIIALGMSTNIKYLDLLGIIYTLFALSLAWIWIRKHNNKVLYLLAIPCTFLLCVVLFNLSNTASGLELFGRWQQG